MKAMHRFFSPASVWRMGQFDFAYADFTFLGHAVPEISPQERVAGRARLLAQLVREMEGLTE